MGRAAPRSPRGQKPGVKAPNPASKGKLRVRTSEETAWQLRLQGFSYTAIGAKMGITGAGAFHMVMRVLARHEVEEAESVPKMRKLETDRCDRHLKQLEKGCAKGNIGSIQTALKVAERRAKLAGLDLAIKVDPLAGEGGAMAVEMFRKMLSDATAAAGAAAPEDEEDKTV